MTPMSAVLSDAEWVEVDAATPALGEHMTSQTSQTPYRVVLAPICSRLIDTVTPISARVATALRAHGIDGAIRYLGGITPAELATLTISGLGVMLVTYSRAEGWYPSASAGLADGLAAVARLRALAAPVGTRVWIDLEGCAGPASQTTAHLETEAHAIVQQGYRAGLYVGAAPGGLDSASLYALHDVTLYWESCSRAIPQPARCGWAMHQLYPPNQLLCGIGIDYDVTCQDFLGRRPEWLCRDQQ